MLPISSILAYHMFVVKELVGKQNACLQKACDYGALDKVCAFWLCYRSHLHASNVYVVLQQIEIGK